jgi:tRNA A-37 threonylcarbamoyl transferase component Bud32
MRRLETQPLSSFNEAAVDEPAVFDVIVGDRKLDYHDVIETTPVITSTYDGKDDPQLSLRIDTDLPWWDETEHYPVGRLDSIHGRTLEVLADTVYIGDQFDNSYASLNIKGCDLSDPYFMRTRTAARGHIIHGLQESLVMERIMRASYLLRQNNIGTEYICGLSMPEAFPIDRHQQGIDHKQQVTLPEFLEYLAGKFAATEEGDPQQKLQKKFDMIQKFQDCDYMITYRAMDTPYRLGELSNKDKFNDFKSFVMENYTDTDLSELIADIDDPDIYAKSLGAYLLGCNVGRMHKIGLRHGFLVPLNISAMGAIIDLDSCRGEALSLGDEATTRKDEVADVTECLFSLREVIEETDLEQNRIDALIHRQYSFFGAAATFLKYYLESRFKTRAEQTDFLADVARYSKLTKDKYEPYEVGIRPYLLAEQSFYTSRPLKIPRAHAYDTSEEVPLAPDFTRPQSFFHRLPAKLFKDLKDRLLDDSWSMNEELANESERVRRTTRRVLPPLYPVVLGHCIEEMLNPEAYGERRQPSAKEILFLAGCALDKITPLRPDRQEAVRNTRAYIKQHMTTMIDRLSQSSVEDVGPVLKPYMKAGLFLPYIDCIGNIDVTGPEDPPVDVLYLEDDQQYLHTLQTLGINRADEIHVQDYGDLYQIAGNHINLIPDSLFIADYKVSGCVAESTGNESANEVLVLPRANAKPLVLVQGLIKGDITVFVQVSPELRSKDTISYEQLLGILAPSLRSSDKDRLFAAAS